MNRRKVDWSLTLGDESARIPSPAVPLWPASLTDKLARARSESTFDAADAVIREAVVLARRELGLERAAVFLLSEKEGLMVGCWGTAADGSVSDEHDISYSVGGMDRQVFEATAAGTPWVVFEDCPRMAHDKGASYLLSRGWVVCTALVAARRPAGIFFNDGGRTKEPIDPAAQARLWLLCALIAPVLDGALHQGDAKGAARQSPLVRKVTALVLEDRSLTGEAIAERLSMSPTSLAREFRRESGQTLVTFRNEARLNHFFQLVAPGGANLLEAALGAGFGSYAQFHRVFRARFGHGPRKYFEQHPALAQEMTTT